MSAPRVDEHLAALLADAGIEITPGGRHRLDVAEAVTEQFPCVGTVSGEVPS